MNEWISVKDKLPEHGNAILMWLDEIHDYKLPVIGIYDKFGIWKPVDIESWFGVILDVTHWMPLPDRPNF